MNLSKDRTRRPVRALLASGEVEEGLDVGLSELLGRLAQELQFSVLTLSGLRPGGSRVFSPWEQVCLSSETRDFLLAAVHGGMVTAEELEHALALLFAQTQGFAELEDIRVLLESVVEDPERQSMLALFDAGNYH